MYRFYKENGRWSNLVNKAYLKEYFEEYCSDYASEFEDWLADMKRNDLVREIWR